MANGAFLEIKGNDEADLICILKKLSTTCCDSSKLP